jgi:hypothetical protein
MIPTLPNITGGAAGPSGAGTGDQSAGIGSAFTFNNAFQVGGSGRSAQTNDSTASSDGGEASMQKAFGVSPILLAVAGGVVVLGLAYLYAKNR